MFGVRGAKGIPWQVLRADTDDGTAFRDVRVVLEGADLPKPPNSEWAHTATVSYSPEQERYLVLKNSRDYGGSFDTHAFVSGDGERWEPSPHNPVYREGDNWGRCGARRRAASSATTRGSSASRTSPSTS